LELLTSRTAQVAYGQITGFAKSEGNPFFTFGSGGRRPGFSFLLGVTIIREFKPMPMCGASAFFSSFSVSPSHRLVYYRI